MDAKTILVIFCGCLLGLQVNAFNKIPTSVKVNTKGDDNKLECSFLLDPDRKLEQLEWQVISGQESTVILTLKGNGASEVHKDYTGVVTTSGLNVGKRLTTHRINVRKNQKKHVDLYKCVVKDDRGKIGSNEATTDVVIKEQLDGSGSGSGDGNVTCGGNFNGSSGFITSPNYPSNYPDNTYCEWTVYAQPGEIVIFDFEFLDLETCCTCDYLEIRDGSTVFDPLIATVCSPHDTAVVYETTGNAGHVTFSSDFSITATGFNLYWQSSVPCGENVTGSSGIIQSPNFPSNYPDYSYCVWTVTVDTSSTVYFELLAFDLENCCSCDYLEIRDGPTESDPLLVTFCDPVANGTIVQTSGNTAFVRFRSDLSITESGFQLYWEAATPAITTEVPSGDVYAFSASLSGDGAINSSGIAFDSVLYNQQGIYNPATGVLAPPVHGLYFVTTSCLSTGGTSFRVYIRRNQDEILCKGFASDDDSYHGTCSAVEEMFPGDEVRVTGDDDFAGVAMGDGFSGFTGYMIARLS